MLTKILTLRRRARKARRQIVAFEAKGLHARFPRVYRVMVVALALAEYDLAMAQNELIIESVLARRHSRRYLPLITTPTSRL